MMSGWLAPISDEWIDYLVKNPVSTKKALDTWNEEIRVATHMIETSNNPDRITYEKDVLHLMETNIKKLEWALDNKK